MPFKNENTVNGLQPNAPFQVGRSNVDQQGVLEHNVGVTWLSDPAGSYVYYECRIEVTLDSGIVVHNQLPQVNRTADTLASSPLDDPNIDQITKLGVNLTSKDQYTDIAQRMAHSRYWFRLVGQAIRLGYRVPIPGIKTIGGQVAIPHDENPQWAYNTIMPGGNFGGIPLWRAEWSLWYTTLSGPSSQTIPVANLSAHISGDDRLPTTVQVPYSLPDDNAVQGSPRKLTNSIVGG